MRKSRVRPSVVLLAAAVLSAGRAAAQPIIQSVSTAKVHDEAGAGERLSIPLSYTTLPTPLSLPGLGLRIHWDSKVLSFDGLAEVCESGFLGSSGEQVDIRDDDGDARTDRTVIVGWADLEGDWPATFPAALLTASFTVAPEFAGTTWVRFSAAGLPAGCELQAPAVTVAQRFWQRFDFGTLTSPLAAGYVRVHEESLYAPEMEFGWLADGVATAYDRAVGSDLGRDLHSTSDGTFAVDLAPGVYAVSITLGDPAASHDRMRVEIEGEEADTVTTRAGESVECTYGVTISDHQLGVRLRSLSGPGGTASVNAVVIAAAPDAAEIRVHAGEERIASGQGDGVQFGTAMVGESAVVRTLAVRNDGGRGLVVTLAAVPEGFAVTDVPTGEIPPGGVARLAVAMVTDVPANRQGNLSLLTNDPDEGSFHIPLQGSVRRRPTPRRTLR